MYDLFPGLQLFLAQCTKIICLSLVHCTILAFVKTWEMYPYNYPHTIRTKHEEITFESIVMEDGERKVIVSNRVQPDKGPPFHVHFKQDESLTVSNGRMGYQILGGPEKFLEKGDTVVFHRGEMHRFWNAGDEVLECTGWAKPANSLDFYLSTLYNTMSKSGSPKGDPFEMAYLVYRYRSEYDTLVVPPFVKRVILPITYFIGKALGKYNHFRDAPKPIR